MQRKLESNKLFPYVAWTIVISFAVFTGNLALQLQAEIRELRATTSHMERLPLESKPDTE